ncbi:MAG: carboxypeptidase-like regulatory domain-containing protein [Deltaproteobacteria bacterium]|nr:carboxypeptidase-like regulatory domain-containing protein [Deltaproteobacteria bacterium]
MWPTRPSELARPEGPVAAAPAPVSTTTPPLPEPSRGAAVTELRQVTGRVVNDQRTPVGGALVGSTAATVEAVRTDGAGRFWLHGLPPGWLQVYAVAPGHASRHILLEPQQDVVELILGREASLHASLFAPARSELLASICRPRDSLQEDPFCVARVVVPAGQRAFEIERLPEGEHELWVEEQGQLLLQLPLSTRAGERLELDGLRLHAEAPASL